MKIKLFSRQRESVSYTPTKWRCGMGYDNNENNLMWFTFIDYFRCCRIPTSSPEQAGWLDTLHVVLSGQGYRPSKPKGLHTGFSGLPRIAVKGALSYV